MSFQWNVSLIFYKKAFKDKKFTFDSEWLRRNLNKMVMIIDLAFYTKIDN